MSKLPLSTQGIWKMVEEVYTLLEEAREMEDATHQGRAGGILRAERKSRAHR